MTPRLREAVIVFALIVVVCSSAKSGSDPKDIRNAVERSTLNQPGTKPFHLKAEIAPSFERDKGSNRTGEVEIWWASPTQWKRELRSPDFHQVAVTNGTQQWQKNEGNYFPEWLREIAVALIEPVPSLDHVIEEAKTGEVRNIFGTTDFSWMEASSDGQVQSFMGAGVTITDNTGLFEFGAGLGWSAGYKDYKSFHGRMVPRKVTSGGIEVTADVTIMEDLKDVPSDFFNTGTTGDSEALIHTVVIDELELRKNLAPMEAVNWPTLANGPLEGNVTTQISVDRTGKVREVGTIVSANPALNNAAQIVIMGMQFSPFIQNGLPVQVVSRITIPFKTTRPAGMEQFASAREYFEGGRRLSFPAAANGPAYVLKAAFQAKIADGSIQEGQYVDTWENDRKWRREATIGKSRYVRSRNGDARYQLSEGPDANILRFILRITEPIPAIDTFVESDWRIDRGSIDGIDAIRVLTGYQAPDGTLDPDARGFWFDNDGKLVHTYFLGLETRRAEFLDFNGVSVAHNIRVLNNGAVALIVRVTDLAPATDLNEDQFTLKGHEWKRMFTDEVR